MIDRRRLLAWMGASVGGALGCRAGNAVQLAQNAGVFALESFHAADVEQMPQLHAYMKTLLPLMKDNQPRPAICLEAIVAPQSPQAMVLAGFASFDEMLATRERIAGHRSIQNKRAELESVLLEVRSQILISGRNQLSVSWNSDALKAGIFEIRTYQCPAWHDVPPDAFRAALNRAGIYPIMNGFAAGEHIPQFTYLIPFESLATREQAWSRLSQDAACVKVTGKSIYKLAPYSALA